MERKIGEVFKYNGKKYIVKEGIGCNNCDIRCNSSDKPIIGNCSSVLRKDNKSIVFVEYNKEEKVMENLLNCKDRRFKCKINNTFVEGKIQVENGHVYLCQNEFNGISCKNKLGYLFSFYIDDASKASMNRYNITNFELIDMTKEEIENYKDWQVGDEIINIKTGIEGVIIFRSGDLVFFKDKNRGYASTSYTLTELYDSGYRLNEEPFEDEEFIELTLEEIAELKGIPVEKLRIKDK